MTSTLLTPQAPQAITMTGSLSQRAMLVDLTIRQWGASVTDKRVTAQATSQNGASSDAGRFTKNLLAKSALDKLSQQRSAIGAYHRSVTLPWLDGDTRIIAASAYPDYAKKVRQWQTERETLVADFAANYAAYVQQAVYSLGQMFDSKDYPDPSKIAGKFAVNFNVFPIPESGDFRVISLGDVEATLIREQIERGVMAAYAGAMNTVVQRIITTVGKMASDLKEYTPAHGSHKAEGVFRDSLVGNVQDLAADLPKLNLMDDPDIAALVSRIEDDLTFYSADALRSNVFARDTVAEKAAAIVAAAEVIGSKMEGYF